MSDKITLPALNSTAPQSDSVSTEADTAWWTRPMATPVGAALRARLAAADGSPGPAAAFRTTSGAWLLVEQVMAMLRDAERDAATTAENAATGTGADAAFDRAYGELAS